MIISKGFLFGMGSRVSEGTLAKVLFPVSLGAFPKTAIVIPRGIGPFFDNLHDRHD